jgi:RsiW-degrading membrane proteinase PrsW (M82 family)
MTRLLVASFLLALVPVLLAFSIRRMVVRLLEGAPRSSRPHAASGWLFPAAVLLGGWGGAVFGVILAPPLARLFEGAGEVAHTLWSSAFVAPMLEELGKALLLLGLVLGRVLRNRLDGVLLGLGCGAGFAFVEALVAYVQALAWGSVDSWTGSVLLRLPFGTLIHLTSTAFVGMSLGWASTQRSGFRWAVAVLGSIPAGMVVHGLWNGLMVLTSRFTAPVFGVLALLVSGGAVLVLVRSIRTDVQVATRQGIEARRE